jgi:hypothetical protein
MNKHQIATLARHEAIAYRHYLDAKGTDQANITAEKWRVIFRVASDIKNLMTDNDLRTYHAVYAAEFACD